MSKLYQIYEDDLEVLERELPAIMEFAVVAPGWNERADIREAFEMVQRIASNVRWNYGPPTEVKKIDGNFNPGGED